MRNQRSGYGLSATVPRTSERQDPAPAGPSFAAMRAQPVSGPFVMPADSALAFYAPYGHSHLHPLVRLTTPDGKVREIASPGLNPGGRTVLSFEVKKGILVDPGFGLEVQVPAGPLEWASIARRF